jgi:CrcB protein
VSHTGTHTGTHTGQVSPSGSPLVEVEMEEVACVAAGAVAGAVLRWKATSVSSRLGLIPWSTAAINVVGSFVLGALAAKTRNHKTTLMLGTGFCGSLTTFSTFSVDVMHFIEDKKFGKAVAYVAINNVVGIGAAAAGYKLFRKPF